VALGIEEHGFFDGKLVVFFDEVVKLQMAVQGEAAQFFD